MVLNGLFGNNKDSIVDSKVEASVVKGGWCMTCRANVSFKDVPVLVEYHSSRGVKYAFKGECVKGHKMSRMTKKP